MMSTPVPDGRAQPVRPDRRHWMMAVAAGMASYLDSSIIVSTAIALPIWTKSLDFNAWMAGAVSAFLTFSIAVGALIGGRVSDVFGRTRVFNLDILLFGIGVGLIAIAPSQTMIMIGVILAGLAAGADLPTSVAVVSERAPAGAQGRLVGFTAVMWTIGIAVTQGLGFALSSAGITGTRVMFGWMTLVALGTWAFRVYNRGFRSLEAEIHPDAQQGSPSEPTASQGDAMPMRALIKAPGLMIALLLTGLFYMAWGLLANTFGQFQAYFLVTVSGASQTLATGIGVALIPIGLVFSIVYVRVLDTKWRNPAFYAGASLQVVAMIIIALSSGSVLPLMLVGLALFNVSNCFAGDATYKVWTQESFPVNARATVQGVSYAICRAGFALFALVTPPILDFSPPVVLWMLVGFAVLTLLFGGLVIRRQQRVGVFVGEDTKSASAA